ncbi:TPA: hypothetical protein ACFB8C_001663, partial [Neisseria gonorrhoeae]
KPAAIRSLPCAGEGWGEGTFQVAATSPKSLSLLKYKPCGLLPSLQPSPTGREDYEARRQARGFRRHCCCGFGRGFIRRQF